MTPLLPQHPHLDHLKKQAKSLLKVQRTGDSSVCALLRQLHRFAEASDADILAADLALHEVQFALALDYGFPSWERLQVFVAGEEPLPSPKMDFSAVAFHGDYCRSDSFSMVITTACALVDRPVSPELVALLAGNGFAPAVRECEPSRHCWHVQAQGENLDLVARAVGLSVRRLPKIDCETVPPMPGDDSARDQWLIDYYRLPCVPAIAQALAKGEVVITDREWDWRHHYNGWCGWGILTEARTDGTILGACLNGRRDNPMMYPEQCFAISSGSVSIPPNDIALEALVSAVQRVRGVGRFAPNGMHIFGLAAMDRWIQEMLDVPGFCAECQAAGRGWVCARNNAGTLCEGAHVVSTALRTYLDDSLSGPRSANARQHIRKAADCYARIAERLRPAAQNDGIQGYESVCPDLTAQQAHVTNVLRPAREDLEEAAIALEGALDALGKR